MRGIVGVLYARKYLYFNRIDNNIYLLDNGNSVLWFLPAMFWACIMFWFIVNSERKRRYLIIVIYFVFAIITSFLPVLLPWSLDTAFSLSIVMYAGYCVRQLVDKIKDYSVKKRFVNISILVFSLTILYCALISFNGGVNISVRIYGNVKIISVLLFTIIGICGSLLYIIIFKAFDCFAATKFIIFMCEFLGKRSIVLMASHIAIFEMLEVVLPQNVLCMGGLLIFIKLAFSIFLSAVVYEILVKLTPKIKILKFLY